MLWLFCVNSYLSVPGYIDFCFAFQFNQQIRYTSLQIQSMCVILGPKQATQSTLQQSNLYRLFWPKYRTCFEFAKTCSLPYFNRLDTLRIDLYLGIQQFLLSDTGELTKTSFISLESPPGYGVLIANAKQLAKIVTRIKISKALEAGVKKIIPQ